MKKQIILLGPGSSLKSQKHKLNNFPKADLMALQSVFPKCVSTLNISPTMWTWLDPHGAVEGLKYLLENKSLLKDIKIIIPHFTTKGPEYFKRFAGTTPVNWEEYQKLLNEVSLLTDITVFDATTAKNISNCPLDNRDYWGKSIHDDEAYLRFMGSRPVFGTVRYDGDYVIGTKYHGGLESKLSSFLFPLCHYLRFNEIYCIGFDFIGPRFYEDFSSNFRSAFGQNVTQINDEIRISLSFIKKWNEWSDLHGMKICSMALDKESSLGNILPKI